METSVDISSDFRLVLDSSSYILCTLIFVVILSVYLTLGDTTETYPLAGYSSSQFFASFRVRLNWLHKGAAFIDDAFAKYPDQIFKLPALNRLSLVLPPRYVDEIKTLPNTVLCNGHALEDFFIGKWTTMDYNIFDDHNLGAIKAQYITGIGSQIEPSADEADFAFERIFSSYENWTSISLDATISPLVAQVVARTIMGPEFSRNPEWVGSLLGYAKSLGYACVYMKLLPPFLRPLAIFIPDYHRIFKYRRKLFHLLSPHVDQQLLNRRDCSDHKPQRGAKTLLEQVIMSVPDHKATTQMMVHRAIGNSAGASKLTAAHVINCVLDLAVNFDTYAPALRKEIEEVLPEGEAITNANLAKLWKLDSFMKESQRFRPFSRLSMNRKVMKPFRLSSGIDLPVGAHVSFAGSAMSMSETYIQNAKTFDGFRFERMRLSQDNNHNGLQFTSSYEGSMHMGHGRQMCPGRFLGGAISKIVLIKLLQRYDFKLKDGQGRPDNMRMFDMDLPHPEVEVLFRDRQVLSSKTSL